MPGWPGMSLAGGVIGLVSSWVGIGGGTLTVPFLIWCNTGLRRAIGTSADGLSHRPGRQPRLHHFRPRRAGLPSGSLGFVYLPALVAIAAGSWLTAPLGARATHRWPVRHNQDESLPACSICWLYEWPMAFWAG
jgi:hypothetical protein